MYLIRRAFTVKPAIPSKAREAAEVLAQIGKSFEDTEQRSPTRVYMSGITVPGPANTIYIDWLTERIESPYREGHKLPDEVVRLRQGLIPFVEESHIEFYEVVKPKSLVPPFR